MAPSMPARESEAELDHPPPLPVVSKSAAPEPASPSSLLSLDKKEPFLQAQWADWRWQLRHRIRSVDELLECFPGLPNPEALVRASEQFPLAITPYYASLIQVAGSEDPIFQMAVPQIGELFDGPFLTEDPLSEEEDMPVPGLVHRYPDRALLIATSACAVYCRHCTRKRVTGHREGVMTRAELDRVAGYLRQHPEIKDVIISGGDPLTLATGVLEEILAVLRGIPSLEIIRIGTRVPVTLPMRITDELVEMLRRYHPVYVNTHFNHPVELTRESTEACLKLADAGIPLGNQSVLLKGVNDSAEVLERLFRALLRTRVRPYYLFQCDLVQGVEHFRTPISRGLEIMEYLRGRISGLAIPTFVVDAPLGGGKIPLLPNYILSMSPSHTVLRNFEGMIVSYPEPASPDRSDHGSPHAGSSGGVWEVATGRRTHLQPERMERQDRRLSGTRSGRADTDR